MASPDLNYATAEFRINQMVTASGRKANTNTATMPGKILPDEAVRGFIQPALSRSVGMRTEEPDSEAWAIASW